MINSDRGINFYIGTVFTKSFGLTNKLFLLS